MPIWTPGNISQEPDVILTNWRILELDSGDRHFCGYNILLREGRVSSRIVEFDAAAMIGKTRSGRTYVLQGPNGYDGDAAYVWASWCLINGIDPASARDISGEIIDG